MHNTYSAGVVTAYGAAKKAGYTGTYEEFCAEQAQFAQNAQQVREDKESVEQTVETFEETTVPAAVQAVTDEGTTQVGRVNQAGATQVESIGSAGTTQVGNVNQAGTTQVAAVNQAGATQIQAVEDKGDEVIESIPQDYSELTAEVDELKNALDYSGIGNSFDGQLYAGYWNASGVLTAYSGDVCPLNKIDCSGNANIVIIGKTNVTGIAYFVSYFDEAGTTRIRRDTGSGVTYTGVAPVGAKYVVFTFEKSGLTVGNIESVHVYVNNSIDALKQFDVEVSNEIDNIYHEIDLYMSKFGARRKNRRFLKEYSMPTGMSGAASQIRVYTDGWNYYHNYDIESKKVSGGSTFYVSRTGTASPESSSEGNPTSLYAIMNGGYLTEGSTIYFTDGVYGDFTRTTASLHDITVSCNLIALHPGKVIEAQIASFPTFTSGGSGKYTASRSNVVKIFQMYNDEIVPLTSVASASDCSSEGTWYLNGSDLTLHLFGGIPPTLDNTFICLNYGVSMLKITPTNDANIYVEGITFIGGTPGTAEIIAASGKTVNFYAKDCKFYGAYDPNLSYSAVGVGGANAVFINCEAMYSSKDGFNYYKNGNNIASFIEINCIGANNGLDGVAEATSQYYQNGSTAHGGAKGLRLGGTYYNNYGGNVADVHQDTETVNIGCTAFDSAAPSSIVNAQADFVAQQAGATMYMIGCRAFGSISSAYAVSGSEINIKTCDFEHAPSGSGTIIT